MRKLIALLVAALAIFAATPATTAAAASTHQIVVDGWYGSTPNAAMSAWSQHTNVTLSATSGCTGPGCIHVWLVDAVSSFLLCH